MPLTVATWNCAHGRGTGPDLRRWLPARRRHTLAAIGHTLADEGVDVAALQEIDGPSWWSGGFDHPHHVAKAGRFHHGVHGHHVHRAGLRYGTALLARVPLADPQVTRFASSFPTPRKGFVVARLQLEGRPVDVVSVHLDFARAAARRRQLDELADTLVARATPTVVMGDLNDEPNRPLVQAFLARTGLRAVADDCITFPKLGRRLDVVFVSPELVVDGHRVLEVDLSDHRPVLARIAWA